MNLDKATLAWVPGTSNVAVLRHPIGPEAAERFECTFGAGDATWNQQSGSERAVAMLAAAIDAIALDGVGPQTMRTALMTVDELRGVFDQGVEDGQVEG